MDSEEVVTPRTGRKKKSTLSKLVARGRRRLDDEAEVGASLPNGSTSQEAAPRYPIDANVEIRSQAAVGAASDDDSDERIEVANDKSASLDYQANGTSGAPVATTSSSQRASLKDRLYERAMSPIDHDPPSGTALSQRLIDELPGPRLERLRSLSMERHYQESSHRASSGHAGLRRSVRSDGEEDLAQASTSSLVHVREAQESQTTPHHNGLWQPPSGRATSPLPAPRSGAAHGQPLVSTRSRSSEDLTTRYRDALQRDDDLDEMADNVSALKRTTAVGGGGVRSAVMTSNMRSATTSSLFSSQDRTWGSLQRFGIGTAGSGGFDTLSQRSYQSTSVLPLITTKEARNRSFLVGSMSGRTALMGLEEMERFFPDHKLRVFTGTWNMCDMKLLPDSLNDWLLPDTSDYIQDMYVLGTQESCTNRKEWEICIQETLGPSHVLFHTAVHGVLYLCVFLRRDLIWFCSVIEEGTVTTRLGPTNVATKGAIALCFTFFGTSFLFLNTHLSPHDGKVKERIADYNKIISSLNLPQVVVSNHHATSQEDVTARFDCVFWLGDLNFRLQKERERVDSAMNALDTQEVPSYEGLMRHDELFMVRNEGLAFQEFQEGRIKFKPTYKFDKGTDNYDTSKKMRIPGYTDRILFRGKKKNSILCLHYDAVHSLKDSDHKPVYSMFEVAIRPGKDSIPLAAGQFNREVWLEGNKRRAERLENQRRRSKASTVCSLQ